MLALLVQTLFALQGATKGNGSYSSHPTGLHLPSPPFVIRKAQGRNTLFASPKLQSEEIDPGETLDWLQARLGLSDDKLAKLVRLQPTILNLSVQKQLEPNISWLQDRLALDQESSKGNATADASIWLGTIAWVKHGRDTRADSCLASRETAS
jgi:hypothetical protein